MCPTFVKALIDDGYCQQVANNNECGYDGGDCCGPLAEILDCSWTYHCKDPHFLNEVLQCVMALIVVIPSLITLFVKTAHVSFWNMVLNANSWQGIGTKIVMIATIFQAATLMEVIVVL